jgi:hypothetical protein
VAEDGPRRRSKSAATVAEKKMATVGRLKPSPNPNLLCYHVTKRGEPTVHLGENHLT